MTELYVGTIIFSLPNGKLRKCETYFDKDMPKLVKGITNYAQNLILKGYSVSGSVIEELDKYWEFDSTQNQGEKDERQI